MSVFSRKSQLIVPSHTVSKPWVLAIETHAHFGSLLGAMAGVSEGYFDLYQTRDAVDAIKAYGIKKWSIWMADGVRST